MRRLVAFLSLLAAVSLPLTAAPTNVRDFGARGDGSTDDSAALAAAFNHARGSSDPVVYIPAGVYRYSRTLTIDGVHVEGAGPDSTILQATDNSRIALRLTGNAPGLRNVTIRPRTAPTKRATTPETAGVHVDKATHFLIDRVTIQSTGSAGIIVRGSSGTKHEPARISRCVINDTLADGIHMTSASSYIDVDQNTLNRNGDDYIAVVSYRNQAGPVHHINITNNTASDQTWGRGITVVGGNDVRIVGNTIRRSSGAGVMLASEAGYNTHGVFRVEVARNLLEGCVTYSTSSHGAILLSGRESSSGQDNRICDVIIADNIVRNSRNEGLRVDHDSAAVSVYRNTIQDSGKSGIVIGSRASKVTLAGNLVDGTKRHGLAVLEGCDRIEVIAEPTLGGANRFNRCGLSGIEVKADGGKGALRLEGSVFSALNTNRVNRTNAIAIIGGASAYTVTVLGNQFNYAPADRLGDLVASVLPINTRQLNLAVPDDSLPFRLE